MNEPKHSPGGWMDSRLIFELIKALRLAILVGHPAPAIRKMCDRLFAPRVGDIVIETSRALRTHNADGLGILVEQSKEDVGEMTFIIRTLGTPKETRWENAEIMALPVDRCWQEICAEAKGSSC